MKNEAVGRADGEEQENVMGKKSEGERRKGYELLPLCLYLILNFSNPACKRMVPCHPNSPLGVRNKYVIPWPVSVGDRLQNYCLPVLSWI